MLVLSHKDYGMLVLSHKDYAEPSPEKDYDLGIPAAAATPFEVGRSLRASKSKNAATGMSGKTVASKVEKVLFFRYEGPPNLVLLLSGPQSLRYTTPTPG